MAEPKLWLVREDVWREILRFLVKQRDPVATLRLAAHQASREVMARAT